MLSHDLILKVLSLHFLFIFDFILFYIFIFMIIFMIIFIFIFQTVIYTDDSYKQRHAFSRSEKSGDVRCRNRRYIHYLILSN
jgi:hypothetical protein